MTDIFISYSRDDQAKVLPIADHLKSMGWSVFMDVHIETGERWDQVIETNLKAAKCVLVVWSPISVDRHWVREEASWGREKEILVPVSIDGAQPPIGFTLFQVQDLDSWSGDSTDPAFQQVITGITRLAGEPSTEIPTQSAEPASSEQTTGFYIDRGNEHFQQGDNNKAIEEYSKAIRLDPHEGKAYFNRGLAYDNKGEFDRAINDYNAAIRLDPQDADAYYNRGVCYYNNDEYDKAIADNHEVIRLDPQYANAYFNRGRAYHQKGDIDKAIADFDVAIRLNPQDADAYVNRGFAYGLKGDADQEIADYRKALAIDPDHEVAKNNLRACGVDV